jgi:hypothetical protein
MALGYSWLYPDTERKARAEQRLHDPRYRVRRRCLRSSDHPDVEIVGYVPKGGRRGRCGNPIR